MPSQLEVKDVSVRYAGEPVVSEVSFALLRGEIASLLGPSGCGKTSLLRAIAGFEPVSAGEIHLHGTRVSHPGRTLAPEKRRVGMVFQDFALYPHLNIEDNVAFGLRGMKAWNRRERVRTLLELVGLSGYGEQFPHQLSGGQQQRVALIRALAPKPEILLLDEPFSGLDVELRGQLAQEIRAILKREAVTAILVTHDQQEAFAMADMIGVLGEGRLRQWDTGYALYHHPQDRFVADFIGEGARVSGRVIGDAWIDSELGRVKGLGTQELVAGQPVQLLIRPDALCHDEASPMKLEILERVFQGADYLYTLGLPSGARVPCRVRSQRPFDIGDQLGVRLNLDTLVAFPDAPDQWRNPAGEKQSPVLKIVG
ncbi:MAG: ABC transporter ATP-binding protein [Candidatus Thiodiazotropha sp.]